MKQTWHVTIKPPPPSDDYPKCDDELIDSDGRSLTPDSLSWGELNQLFYKAFGGGVERIMVIGGVPVRKKATFYVSDSGKTRGFTVAFAWRGADGKDKQVCKLIQPW
jgi:hypothetical protein